MTAEPTPSPTLVAAVSPAGHVYLDTTALDAVPLPAATEARIRAAFSRGAGHGVLHLGAVEVTTHLPPSLAFFRTLGHAFMARLCALPDLDERGAKAEFALEPEQIAHWLESVPPMTGAEYLDATALGSLWNEVTLAARAEMAEFAGTAQEWLRSRNPAWNSVGRVCFHLVENKRDPEFPFAFLATYTPSLSSRARAQHRPLGEALREASGDRDAMLSLLAPVQRAAEKSDFVRGLVDSGEIYAPQAWGPSEAFRFLSDVPALESSGVVVRVPDWWSARKPPRPQVRITLGGKSPAGLGTSALLDFDVKLVLGDEALSEHELQDILRNDTGLALLRGRWVAVDREKLTEVLERWKVAQKAAGTGVTFAEAMRLLAGASELGDDAAEEAAALDGAADWSQVVAGKWASGVLAGLRDPAALASVDPGKDLAERLRPYQRDGLRWLWSLQKLGLGACLADDMGLGKTVQVIALLRVLERQSPGSPPHLLVVPASLVANWRDEIARFAPDLRVLIAHASAMDKDELAAMPAERVEQSRVVITTYGTLLRIAWLRERAWGTVVLDEAQAIKNPGAKQTRAVKSLHSASRIALTGTPVENRLGDLWSLFDFLNPGLLGGAKDFSRFVKKLGSTEPPSYAPLRNLIRPYVLRRLKTDRAVITDLPDKTEVTAWCGLTKRQAALYQQSVDAMSREIRELDGMQRRGHVLAYLTRFKQICNHPSQWLADGSYDPTESGKFARLREICEEISERQEKVLVFTQFREMTEPLNEFLATVFGRRGLVLHGGTPVKSRAGLVKKFQDEEARVPYFVISLKAGGTGLNLTAASHVIHFDRWWNPAVENQATDRAFRIGQKRNVLVHRFVCKGTVEERVDAMLESKRGLQKEVLEGGAEVVLTEMSDAELVKLVSLDWKGMES